MANVYEARTGRIRRRNLHEETADRIRVLILDGALPPGKRISEKTLCDEFGVSRTPVREALKALATEGLVTITPNRGAAVTEITNDELADAFPVMGALEGLAGELAAEHMADVEIAAIARLHDQMLAHVAARALGPYFTVNQRIHQSIVAGARNNVLREQYDQISARMRLARYRANMSDTRWAQAVAEHEQILTALKARDGKRLGQILRAHLDGKWAVVRETAPAE
ncbi:MAG: GntR family transcriptional regulator [Pseudomonadota bacterium]